MAEKQVVFDSVSDTEVSDNADLHGIVGNPMKKGPGMASYFHAVITDGHKQMKVVEYSPGQRKRLASSESAMDAINLHGCQVKRTNRSDDLQVVLKSRTEVQSSPKKYSKSKVARPVFLMILSLWKSWTERVTTKELVSRPK